MRRATLAPAYACLYAALCDIVRDRGYALAIHGSLLNDLDLIAVPWTDECSSPEEVMQAVVRHINLCGLPVDTDAIPEYKPHGRIAWKLQIEFGAAIDLSIITPETSE